MLVLMTTTVVALQAFLYLNEYEIFVVPHDIINLMTRKLSESITTVMMELLQPDTFTMDHQ